MASSRKRLEDSRKLWQFYWDMADEENWIKEKEQIVSVDDIGHDLTTGKFVRHGRVVCHKLRV